MDNRRDGTRAFGPKAPLIDGPEPIVFLYRGNQLIDATTPAKSMIGQETGNLPQLLASLEPRFPGLTQRWSELATQGRIEVTGNSGTGAATLRLLAEDLATDTIRLTITDPTAEDAGIMVDSLSLLAMEEELDLLRNSMNHTPMLAWRQNDKGEITWANAAYLARADEATDGELSWPLPRLTDLPNLPEGTARLSKRTQIKTRGSVLWFDCHAHRSGEQTMYFALPADAAVRAEKGLREFVQTLTKTFADLPTGLAIFDRQRNLQLFNPALIDLTGLTAGFLTARPTLFDFLDKLRNARMVPEPKDYRSWRQQMSNLETAAATGRHVETWSLPDGRTYRVTGRPHPDGAVAFLLEDITSQISMTRKFRADLSLSELVMDGIDDALVVFGRDGKLLLSNHAYQSLWNCKCSSVPEAIRTWREKTPAGAGLDALEKNLTDQDRKDSSDGAMAAPDGGLVSWSVRPLPGGRQMVRFRSANSALSADRGQKIDAVETDSPYQHAIHAGRA